MNKSEMANTEMLISYICNNAEKLIVAEGNSEQADQNFHMKKSHATNLLRAIKNDLLQQHSKRLGWSECRGGL